MWQFCEPSRHFALIVTAFWTELSKPSGKGSSQPEHFVDWKTVVMLNPNVMLRFHK